MAKKENKEKQNKHLTGTLQELREDFLLYLEVELRRSPRTIDGYSKDTRYFISYLEKKGIKDITTVTPQILSAYIQHLASKKSYKPRSLARNVATLKVFFNFLQSENIVEDNPARRLVTPKLPRGLPRYLTKDEVNRLVAAADDGTEKGFRNSVIIAFMFYTGTRLDEAINVRLKDLAPDLSAVEIQHGKGDRYRKVPLHTSLEPLLRKYIDQVRDGCSSPYLFPGVKGEKLSPGTVRKVVRRAAEKAGLRKDVTPHVLRHSVATCLAQADGVDILDISKFLGHARLRTTKIYLHTDLTRLREAVEKLPVIRGAQEEEKWR